VDYVRLHSDADATLLAVVARTAGQTIGLGLADVTGPEAKLRSLFVEPEHWGQGIGSGLLAEVEAGAQALGARRIEAMYETVGESSPAARLAQKRGWRQSQPSTMVCRASERMRRAPWMKTALPVGFELFPWSERTQADEMELLREPLWYPSSLAPDGNYEPLNSLGLRRDGRLVGWMITHRLGPSLVRYTSLFVSPEQRTLGPGMALLARAIVTQLDAGVTDGIFGVGLANKEMIRLVKRRLAPYLDELREIFYVAKDL
jgi:GNAT superfamily N-acetyltransferase